MYTLLSLTLKVIASLIGGNGTADEKGDTRKISYKAKGENGELIQVFEEPDKKGIF